MTPSVSPEADWELTEAALYYAREANADLGLAFIAEFERGIALLCTQPIAFHRGTIATPVKGGIAGGSVGVRNRLTGRIRVRAGCPPVTRQQRFGITTAGAGRLFRVGL